MNKLLSEIHEEHESTVLLETADKNDDSRIPSPSDSCSSNTHSNGNNENSSGYESNKASETDENEIEYDGEPVFIYVNEGHVFKVKVDDEIQEIIASDVIQYEGCPYTATQEFNQFCEGPATVKMIAKDTSSLPAPINMYPSHCQPVERGICIPAFPGYTHPMAASFLPFNAIYATPIYPLMPVSAQCVHYDELTMCPENGYHHPSMNNSLCSMDEAIRNTLLHQLSQVVAPKVVSVEPIAAMIELLPRDLPVIGKSYNVITVYSVYIARVNPYEECPMYREIYRGTAPDIYIIDLMPNTKYAVRCSLALVFDNYHTLLVGDRSEAVYFDTPLIHDAIPFDLDLANTASSIVMFSNSNSQSNLDMDISQDSNDMPMEPSNFMKCLPEPLSFPPSIFCKGDLKLNSAEIAWKMPYAIEDRNFTYVLEQKVNAEFREVYSGTKDSFEMTGLHPYTQYTVRVYCKTDCGNSPYSSDLTFTTLSGVPGKIKNVSVSQRSGAAAVAIKWTNPSHDGGFVIEEYIVRLICQTCTHEVEKRVVKNECEIKSLRPVSTYKVTVAAVNKLGIGDASKPVEFTTAAVKPLPPMELKAALSSDCVEITWEEPDFSGLPIMEYKLYSTSQLPLFCELYTGTERKFIYKDLLRAQTYYFKVKAMNEIGSSDFSSVAELFVPATAPSRIKTIRHKSDYNSINYSWDPPSSNGSPITKYTVLFQSEVIELPFDSTCYVVDGLKPLTQYEFKIAANNSIGCGKFSEKLVCSTTDYPPLPPKLELSASSTNSLRLFWLSDNENKEEKAQYTLEMVLSSSRSRTLYSGYRTSFKVSRLTPNTVYTFRICAANSNGRGDWSPLYRFETAKSPPSSVNAFKVKNTEDRKCVLSWSAHRTVDDSDIAYELAVRIKDSLAEEEYINCGSRTTYSYTSLRPNCAYEFRVRAVKLFSNGEKVYGPYSSTITVNMNCSSSTSSPKSDPLNFSVIRSIICTYASNVAHELKDYRSLFISIFLFILSSFLIHVFAQRTLEL